MKRILQNGLLTFKDNGLIIYEKLAPTEDHTFCATQYELTDEILQKNRKMTIRMTLDTLNAQEWYKNKKDGMWVTYKIKIDGRRVKLNQHYENDRLIEEERTVYNANGVLTSRVIHDHVHQTQIIYEKASKDLRNAYKGHLPGLWGLKTVVNLRTGLPTFKGTVDENFNKHGYTATYNDRGQINREIKYDHGRFCANITNKKRGIKIIAALIAVAAACMALEKCSTYSHIVPMGKQQNTSLQNTQGHVRTE